MSRLASCGNIAPPHRTTPWGQKLLCNPTSKHRESSCVTIHPPSYLSIALKLHCAHVRIERYRVRPHLLRWSSSNSRKTVLWNLNIMASEHRNRRIIFQRQSNDRRTEIRRSSPTLARIWAAGNPRDCRHPTCRQLPFVPLRHSECCVGMALAHAVARIAKSGTGAGRTWRGTLSACVQVSDERLMR